LLSIIKGFYYEILILTSVKIGDLENETFSIRFSIERHKKGKAWIRETSFQKPAPDHYPT